MTPIDKSNKKGYTGSWNVPFFGKLLHWKQSFEKHIGSFTVNLLNFNQSAKPHKGRKVRDMFSSFNALRGRLIFGVSSVIVLASLAACGGGGSSTDPVPDKKAASVSFEGTTTCTVPIGSKECPVIVAWNAQNVNSLVVTVDSVTVGTTTQGKSTAVVGTGEKVVTAFDGTTVVGTTKITITCDGGMTPIEGVCKAFIARYSEFKLVRLADQGGYIGMIMPDGSVTPLKNNSEFTVATTGALAPLAICAIWDTKLVSGWPVVSCQTPGNGGNLRRNFPVDPINGSVEKEYTGVIPAGASLRDVGYGTFGDTPYAAHGVSQKGMYIETKEGTYFFTDTDSVHLRLTSDNFATNKAVETCSAIDCFHYLAVFSN